MEDNKIFAQPASFPPFQGRNFSALRPGVDEICMRHEARNVVAGLSWKCWEKRQGNWQSGEVRSG